MTNKLTLLMAVLLLSVPGARSAPEAALPPNIVLILTDDQSWAGTTVRMDRNEAASRGADYVTPAAERLANEGMRFSAGYAAAPICSPSRYSIQYGQSPARHGITYVTKTVDHFDHETPDTLAELVKKADPRYATAHFGKWHIDALPEDLGFDESDGRTGNREGGFEPKHEHTIVKMEKDPKLTTTLMRRANEFMTRQVMEERPFFLQISHYANHTWITADPDDILKYEAVPKKDRLRHPAYSAMTEALDRSIGGVLAKIDELDISRRTYVIFTSDNGAMPSFPPVPKPKHNLNGPLRDGKWSVLEGGIRVPLIVRGPGIPPGTQCDAPVSGVDFLPTIAELAGIQALKTDQVLDGQSFTSLLRAGNHAPDVASFDQRPMIWHYPKMGKWEMTRPGSVIRRDGWKYVHSWKSDRGHLYHISEDLRESEDLADAEPERAAALQEELFTYLREVGQPIPPLPIIKK